MTEFSAISAGEGNTISSPPKQVSPSIRWCFTLNNYTDDDISSISSMFQAEARYSVVGKEVGECGTPHLQGYIEFKRKMRPLSLGLTKSIHWEKAKGSRDSNYMYCSKDNEVVIGIGVPKPIKILPKADLYAWQLKVLDDIKVEPDDRIIYWLWSEAGGVGKTSFQKYLTVKHGACILGGKAADCRNGIVDWFKRTGSTPELVCCNVPRSFNSDYVSYEAFENIKDMLFYSGKYEGGMICGNSPHLFIFANVEPDVEKLSADRWQIIKLD